MLSNGFLRVYILKSGCCHKNNLCWVRLICEISYVVNDRQITVTRLRSIKKKLHIFLMEPLSNSISKLCSHRWYLRGERQLVCLCSMCCIWIWADPWSERVDDKCERVNNGHSCRHTRYWSQARDGLHPRRVLHGGDRQHDRWKRPGELRKRHRYHSQLPCWRPR